MVTNTVTIAQALKFQFKYNKFHSINIKNPGVNIQLKHKTFHSKNIKTLGS
jgi:hypothetical protein